MTVIIMPSEILLIITCNYNFKGIFTYSLHIWGRRGPRAPLFGDASERILQLLVKKLNHFFYKAWFLSYFSLLAPYFFPISVPLFPVSHHSKKSPCGLCIAVTDHTKLWRCFFLHCLAKIFCVFTPIFYNVHCTPKYNWCAPSAYCQIRLLLISMSTTCKIHN